MLFLHFVEVSTHGGLLGGGAAGEDEGGGGVGEDEGGGGDGEDEGGGGEDEGGGGEDEGGGGGDATHVTSQPVSSVGQSTAERVL